MTLLGLNFGLARPAQTSTGEAAIAGMGIKVMMKAFNKPKGEFSYYIETTIYQYIFVNISHVSYELAFAPDCP